MIEAILTDMNSMMIDLQPIDHEMVIDSIKINMIIPKIMEIRNLFTSEIIMVMKTITIHINNGRATRIEAKESSTKTTLISMAIRGQNRGYRCSNNVYPRNKSFQPRKQYNNGYQQGYP